MTRDGGTVLMRIGVHALGTKDRTGGRVGAYDTRSTKTAPLPGKRTISGDGKVVLAPVVVDQERSQWVAVTGWEPAATVAVRASADRSTLLVDVDPNKGSQYRTLKVQIEQSDGTWRTLTQSYRTRGSKETRTINLGAGTYRVLVKAKFGYLGATSRAVTLTR